MSANLNREHRSGMRRCSAAAAFLLRLLSQVRARRAIVSKRRVFCNRQNIGGRQQQGINLRSLRFPRKVYPRHHIKIGDRREGKFSRKRCCGLFALAFIKRAFARRADWRVPRECPPAKVPTVFSSCHFHRSCHRVHPSEMELPDTVAERSTKKKVPSVV